MPSDDRRADRRHLLDTAYADPSGLQTRAALYDHQQPRIDLTAELVGMARPVAGERVADVGCGNGRYLAALAAVGANVVGLDLSAGMLTAAPSVEAGLVAADAESLPLATASIDLVVMMHMLYHVPRPEVALREARRVLRPGGRLLVGTNSSDHLREMNEQWLPLLDEIGFGGRLADVGLINPRVTAVDARRMMTDVSSGVEERPLRSKVILDDPGPLVRHAATTTGAAAVGEHRDDLLRRLEASVEDRIRVDGRFEVTTEVVLLLART